MVQLACIGLPRAGFDGVCNATFVKHLKFFKKPLASKMQLGIVCAPFRLQR
jgi:hypothetical protein